MSKFNPRRKVNKTRTREPIFQEHRTLICPESCCWHLCWSVVKVVSARSALEREARLERAVGVHGTPVGLVGGLAVVTGGVGLPRLIKSFEVKGINAPVKGTADSGVVVVSSVLCAGLGVGVVVTTIGGPASLAVPELEAIEGASQVLNVAKSLLDVVEVGLDSAVTDVVALPVSEGVGEDELDTTLDDSVTGAVSPLVPAVGSTNQGIGERILDVVDLLEELVTVEVAA